MSGYLGARSSLKRNDIEMARPPSSSLPCTLEVTFTRQVNKKNKVFSEGKLHVSEIYHLRITDEFEKPVGSADLRSNTTRRNLFCEQYIRALENSQGSIQGVIEGVIFHLDCPPLLEGLIPASQSSLDFPQEEIKSEEKETRLVFREFEPLKMHKMPMNLGAGPTKKRIENFQYVTNVNELMSVRGTTTMNEMAPEMDWRLRVINDVYRSVFEAFHYSGKFTAFTEPGCKLKKVNDKVYLCLPPNCLPMKDRNDNCHFDFFSVILGGVEALFKPQWKAFDFKGQIHVKPLSREAASIVASNSIACVRGFWDLNVPLNLIEEVTKRSNYCIFDATPIPKLTCAYLNNNKKLFPDILTEEQQVVVNNVSEWFNNEQYGAICVEGVFGSGKSMILAACASRIDSIAVKDARILIIASTNVAVDNVLKKYLSSGSTSSKDIARIGVSDRVDPELRPLFTSDLKDVKNRRIIGATAASAKELNFHCHFLIIDEAYQMCELTALMVILRVSPLRILLFGDPKQLSQVNCSTSSRTIMESIQELTQSKNIPVKTQFRCREEIANICSHLFYNGTVKTHNVSKPLIACHSLPVVGVVSHSHPASRQSLSSQRNELEAELIIAFLKKHLNRIIDKSIAVITFYCPQVDFLKDLLRPLAFPSLAVHTVDSCQGSEAEIVILSVVASDFKRSKPFIAHPNRVNVALSRAKENLIVFAHESVLNNIDIYSFIAQSSVQLTV